MAGQNYINHIVVELDCSGSMFQLESAVVKVADSLIADLAEQSKRLNQETRITIYAFDTTVKCLIWDMDVLRAPSLSTLYKVNSNGMTALIDATLKGIEELSLVTQIHGDHSFLMYVLTDGAENASRSVPATLKARIEGLPENWTLGALVPNFQGVAAAKAYGFPAGNVITWDATSVRGVEEVGEKIATANASYMTSRAQGVRSSKNVFGAANAVSTAAVAASGIKPADPRTFDKIHVPGTIPEKTWIMNYVRDTLGLPYRLGACFYELTKREKIAADKEIAIIQKKGDGKVYIGYEARRILGLPDGDVRVAPGHNLDWMVLVQSKSTNRHLVPNSTLLIRKL